MLFGCVSNARQSVYVMPAPASLNAGLRVAPATLALKLLPVILPDYLDTTDLITRTGQYGIEASRTARWGERLSKGVTRSLAADLCHRLPAYVATDVPAVQIEVTVSAFDVTAATSVLAASWTVVWQTDARPPAAGHGKFSTGVAAPRGDLAIVSAMAATIAELSDGIAATTRPDAADNSHLALRK
jgi:uncharacterized lipoprotein YmbA